MYVSTKWTLFYSFLCRWGKIAVSNFYDEIEIVGLENLPDDKPIIFIANHQCTFMDPVAIAVLTPNRFQPAFLTRADVFKNPIVHFLLNKMKMMPIYRQRDGADFIQKNEEIFQNCKDLLANQQSFIIFVEGSHSDKRKLRHVKKGFARMGFDAEQDNDFSLDVHVVPIGLNYSHFEKFKSDYFINIGKPIKLSPYYDLYKEHKNKALNKIKNDAFKELEQYILHIPNLERYDAFENIRTIASPSIATALSLNPQKLSDKFKAEKYLLKALNEIDSNTPDDLNGLESRVLAYMQDLEKLDFRPLLFDKEPKSSSTLILQFIGMFLLIPFHLYGVLFNYAMYKFIEVLANKFFADRMYRSSVKMAMGMFLFPPYYLILSLIFWLVFRNFWWTLLFLGSIILAGKFSAWYWRKYKKLKAQWRYQGFVKKEPTQWEKLNQQHQRIVEETKGLVL